MRYNPEMHEIGHEDYLLSITPISPSTSLKLLVQNYFLLNNERQTAVHDWYMLPDNNVHLIFYLFDQGKSVVPDWRVIGPRSKHKIINRKNRLFTFCCTFQPGGFRPFTDIPISELVDRSSPTGAILKDYSYTLFEQLTLAAMAGDIASFVSNLEAYLIRISQGVLAENFQFLSNIGTHSTTAEMAKEFGYSERHLRNLTRDYIGHSPKRVQQIQRLTQSLYHSTESDDWTQIAYSSGYYDQSHMIADFQKFIGSSPTQLLS